AGFIPIFFIVSLTILISQRPLIKSQAITLPGTLFTDPASIDGVNKKIDAMIAYFSLREQVDFGSLFFLPLGISVVMTIAVAILVMIGTYFLPSSYVAMNDFSRSYFTKRERKKKIILYSVLGTLALSVVAGVFSNWIWTSIVAW